MIYRVEKSLISESRVPYGALTSHETCPFPPLKVAAGCRSANKFGCALRRCLDPFASRRRRKGVNLKEPPSS